MVQWLEHWTHDRKVLGLNHRAVWLEMAEDHMQFKQSHTLLHTSICTHNCIWTLDRVYDAIKKYKWKHLCYDSIGAAIYWTVGVRLLKRTQDRNDVSIWNLVQMLHRHRYTTLFSWNFKFLFTVRSNMIGRFIVAMATKSKHWRHDYVCYVTKYLCPKFGIDGLFNF